MSMFEAGNIYKFVKIENGAPKEWEAKVVSVEAHLIKVSLNGESIIINTASSSFESAQFVSKAPNPLTPYMHLDN